MECKLGHYGCHGDGVMIDELRLFGQLRDFPKCFAYLTKNDGRNDRRGDRHDIHRERDDQACREMV